MKKILCGLLLVLAAVVAVVPLWAVETEAATLASGSCGENVSWKLDDKGVLTISGSGPMYDFVEEGAPWAEFPALVKKLVIKKGVTSVGSWAFDWCTCMTSATIPSGVTTIGSYAFQDCVDLTQVTIPNSVTTVGEAAFSGCSRLEKATLSDKLTVISKSMFLQCDKLSAVTIGKKVTTIGDTAFYSCDSLATVKIGKAVTRIGDSAFEDCEALDGIWVDTDNPNYASDESGVLLSKDKTLLIQAPGGLSGSYTAPEGVKTVGANAFSGCDSLMRVTLSEGITVIEAGGLSDCYELREVTIPESMEKIGAFAFGWTNLQDVYYMGSPSGWQQIEIAEGNHALERATIHCAKHDHTYSAVTVEPTCILPGGTQYTCSCGESYMDDVIPALGHTFEGETCSVCGAPKEEPGNMDGTGGINEDDAIYLLQHVLMPEMFPIRQPADFDGSGRVNEDDAIYLLQHILMPEMFPL